ncbi:uncharacterized protein LOC120660148 [Panicum virgatum]|uniref:Uncharacterized protein n=1 Tax=Panicum virgatum TaxID=38727 RepID=A0A8T0VAU4_PANVG|nr:uncharacterized protein LOC120660148 [Panicum virgatum]KAG2633870.1 hypothetical protein PVAP13_2NG230406 [Panicum virgatum]KAG2633871.1 hypothetical protein PVAP13_2NG230406 [Panicum virgatum]KAG2633872.1 hypothetical protein PVAP13_2NG230406 [Panicum virgatum]
MAAVRAAVAACRLTRRFLSSSSSSSATPASRSLLGYFHHPTSTARPIMVRSASAPVFQPLSAGTPRLSLDFLSADAATSGFTLFDSHHGLLLLLKETGAGPRFLVCDPVSRRHTLLPSLPAAALSAGEFLGAAILSRAAGSGFEFRAVCLTVHADRPRLWLAWSRDGEGSWLGLPPSRDFRIKWPLSWAESHCVRAAGSLYWHISNNDSALALDPNTLQFSYLRAPPLVWDDLGFPNYRIGETLGDGRLCFAALESQVLRLCARRAGSVDGWVLEREASLTEAFDSVTDLPMDCTWLGNIDPGRTGKVFIRSFGHGHFSYDMDTGKLDRLTTDDGQEYGHPIFAYFSAPFGGSD